MGFWFKRRINNSGQIARNRLKMLLVSDKNLCTPLHLELIREDLDRVLSKYMEVESNQIELNLTGIESAPVLLASVPLKKLINIRN